MGSASQRSGIRRSVEREEFGVLVQGGGIVPCRCVVEIGERLGRRMMEFETNCVQGKCACPTTGCLKGECSAARLWRWNRPYTGHSAHTQIRIEDGNGRCIVSGYCKSDDDAQLIVTAVNVYISNSLPGK